MYAAPPAVFVADFQAAGVLFVADIQAAGAVEPVDTVLSYDMT
jgi:hypothetical protein